MKIAQLTVKQRKFTLPFAKINVTFCIVFVHYSVFHYLFGVNFPIPGIMF